MFTHAVHMIFGLALLLLCIRRNHALGALPTLSTGLPDARSAAGADAFKLSLASGGHTTGSVSVSRSAPEAARSEGRKLKSTARRKWRDPNPLRYNPTWPWRKAGQGPCSKAPVTIPVTSAADISKRLHYAPTKTVFLVLQNSITASEGIVLGPRYSCTILTAAKPGLWIRYSGGNAPVLTIANTSNVAVVNVSLTINFDKAQGCKNRDPEGSGQNYVCPSVLVWRSYGVQLARGTVIGRVQLVRSMFASVDSMSLTSKVFSFVSNPGAIRVLLSGNGPLLLRSGISISNNNVYGVDQAIVLHEGAVGVDVYNNYVHDYGFAGIRCGDYESYQGDCMLSNIFRNYVYSAKSNVSGDGDAAGIYYNTHWYNPGNLASCNYVVGGDRCYYLDNHSSGINIIGSVCLRQRDGGVKINGGLRNVAKYVVVKSIGGMPSWAQCLFVKHFNCKSVAGKKWRHLYQTYYNSPVINKMWPWFSGICDQTTANGGKPCNPPGAPSASVTAKCSGLANNNFVDTLMVNTSKAPGTRYCEDYPQVESLNNWVYLNWTNPNRYQFVNNARNNLALKPSSPVYRLRPNFRSCDKRLAGPRRVRPQQYLQRFNIPWPYGFGSVLRFKSLQILDFNYNPSR